MRSAIAHFGNPKRKSNYKEEEEEEMSDVEDKDIPALVKYDKLVGIKRL